MSINGVELGYERVGRGRPVLLIGGTGMPPIAWQVGGLQPALVEAGFDVVSYAARGVAPSDAPPAPYTVDDLAADAAGLLDALELSDVAVVGYSLGSFTAELLARTRPDLVRSLVLLGGAGPVTPLLGAVLKMETELIATSGRISGAAAKVQTLLTGLPPVTLRDDDHTVSQWLQMLSMQAQMWTSPDGENGQSAASDEWIRDTTRMAELATINVPALVASFEYDLYFPPRSGRIAAQALPRGEFIEIQGAAHAGLMTHPAETTHTIEEFLTRS